MKQNGVIRGKVWFSSWENGIILEKYLVEKSKFVGESFAEGIEYDYQKRSPNFSEKAMESGKDKLSDLW